MVEMILVVLILVIVSTLAVPQFAKSMKGAKMRTSVRNVVMMHRYARSSAVLEQADIVMFIDTVKGELGVINIGSATQDDMDGFLDSRRERTYDLDEEVVEQDPEAKPSVALRLVRELQEGIDVFEFTSDEEAMVEDGIYWINYYPNGMCDEYALKLRDENHNIVSIIIDPIAGAAEVKDE